MKTDMWGVVIAGLTFLSMIGFVLKLVYSNFKKDKTIIDLEFEKEKSEAKEEISHMSIDTIIARIRKRLSKR